MRHIMLPRKSSSSALGAYMLHVITAFAKPPKLCTSEEEQRPITQMRLKAILTIVTHQHTKHQSE